jgi:hypothetical protein
MRDIKRIRKFCNELADIWEKNTVDWRFGQLICNVFGQMAADGRDPFFPEEDEMIKYFRNYFKNEEN